MKTILDYIKESNTNMECISYAQSDEAAQILNELEINDGENPEGYVLTNNGAADLEQKGISGVFVWCGYLHGSKSRKLASGLHDWAIKVAETMEKYYNGKAVIEDKVKISDMYRIYIKL